MNISIEALIVLIYITPGLFATMILDAILVRRDKDALTRIIKALVFSLIVYGASVMFVGHFPITITNITDRAGKIITRLIDFEQKAIIPTILSSFVFPLAVGFLLTNPRFMKVLRRLRVTDRTERESTWLDVFLDQKRYVIVNLSDGRRIFGWPLYYSDNRDEGMVYIADAAWLDEQGEPQETGNQSPLMSRSR